MIIGHSLIAITGVFLIYDWIKFKKQKQKEAKKALKSIKLCLTGGPCGGKSEGINCIYNTFKHIGAPILNVPEAATIIGSAGLPLDFANFSQQQIELYQIYLMRLQYHLEHIYESISKTLQKLGKCSVILCDRGLLDGKAYVSEQIWFEMLKVVKITQQQINKRYKAVIHMQTAAKGASQNYFYVPHQSVVPVIKQQQQVQGNMVRKESPQRAIQLDQKMQHCYKDHPKRFIIRNYFFVKGFEMKKTLLIAQVNQILEYILNKNNIQSYYQQYQKKALQGDQGQFISPYLLRKKKYQKFLKRQDSL